MAPKYRKAKSTGRKTWPNGRPAPAMPVLEARRLPEPEPAPEPTPMYTAIRFFRPDGTHVDVLRGTNMTAEERAAIHYQGPTALVVQHGIEWYLYIDAPAEPVLKPAPGAVVVGKFVDGRVVRG